VLRWLVVAGLAGLAFLPWMAVSGVLQRGGFRESPIDWIAEAHWYEPLLTFYAFGLGGTADPTRWWNWLAALALLVSCGWGVRQLLRRGTSPRFGGGRASPLAGQMVLCWPMVPLLLMWLLSVDLPGVPQRRSIYMDRYVTWLLPPFALLVAWGWQRWRRRHWSAWVAAPAYLACLLISLGTLYTDPRCAREDWRAAVESLNRLAGHNAVLISRPVQRLPLSYYLPSAALTVVEAPDGLPPEGDLFGWLGLRPPPDAGGTELWMISSHDNTDPHGFPAQRNRALAEGAKFDGLKNWLDARYRVAQSLNFPGMVLTCYHLGRE